MNLMALTIFFVGIGFTLVLMAKKGPKERLWPAAAGMIPFIFVLLLVFRGGRLIPGAIARSGGQAMTRVAFMPGIFVLAILLVALIVLLIKAPKAAAALVGGLACLAFIGGLFLRLPYRSAKNVETYYRETSVAEEVAPLEEAVMSPIWSEGIDKTFDADVYPSKLAAARALGQQMLKPLREAIADANTPAEIVIFQEGNERSLVATFKRAVELGLPNLLYSIEADLRNIRANEMGLTLRRETTTHKEPYNEGTGLTIFQSIEGGRMVATILGTDSRTSVEASYVEKPWVENFAAFASERPQEHYLVARSHEACTSENEAKQQAMQSAAQLLINSILRERSRWGSVSIDLAQIQRDMQDSGLIVDQFVQSFDGSAGRIWRQALLIDTSAEKLAWLKSRVAAEVRVRHIWLFKTIGSALGVLLVIVVTYLFLNMATRGYYDWSLRIAGVVLAIVGVIVIFLTS